MFNKQFFRFLSLIPRPKSLTAKALLMAALLTPFAALAANSQPTITSNPQTTAIEDDPYLYVIVAEDDDGDTLTYSVDSLPNWLAFNSSTQTISGTPTNADIGPHNMKVSVSDGSFVVSQNFTVTISNSNDVPTIVSNIANQTILEDVDFKLDISGNFSDVDADDTMTFTAENLPSGLTLGSNGNIIGAPNNSDALASPFNVTITATDTAKAFAATDFQIVVVNVNDAPEPLDDNVTLAEDGSTNIDILLNDVDVDNDLLPSTAFITNTPINGQATVDTSTGIITYTPNADYNGSDTMTYRITDPDGLAGTATISLTITEVNDAPTAHNDVAGTEEDTKVFIDVLVNDTDPDVGDAPQGDQIVIESTPTNGEVAIFNGLISYLPAINYSGTDSFTYKVADKNGAFTNTATVTVTIGPVNDFPVAANDSVNTLEDTAVSFVVVNNDADTEDGSIDPSTVVVINQPTHGLVSLNTDGTLSYTPEPDYNGTDTFEYTVSDSKGFSSNAATVTITINPVNDNPIANNDLVTLDEDNIIDINILGNDTDIDGNATINPASVTITIAPKHGELFIDSTTGIVKFTPETDYFGSDTFSYSMQDSAGLESNAATVLLTINAVNDPPRLSDDSAVTDEDTTVTIAILPNDTDIDGTLANGTLNFTQQPVHGAVTFNSAGEVVYVPNLNFHGNDQFSYNISDNSDAEAERSATVLLTITSINDAPIAIDGDSSTHEDKTVDIVLSGSDVDEDTLSFTIIDQPTQGVISGNNANWSYLPNENYHGSDSFTFKANDGFLDSQVATISITVVSVNDRPVATAQTVSVNEDSSIQIVLDGTDIDGDSLTFRLAGGDLSGTITGSTPNITYSPGENFNGSESLLFIANDGSLDSASESVTVQVLSVNDVPTVTGQDLFLAEDSSIAFKLSADDIDGDTLTYIIETDPANGVLGGVAPNLIYQPNENYHGSDSLTFKVNDGNADSTIATVTFEIAPNSDAPTATAQSIVGDEDTEITVTLLGVDPDGNALSYQVITNPQHGSLEGTAPDLIYLPNQDYNGSDTFEFRVSDGNFESELALVTIEVSPVNDAPLAQDDSYTLSMTGLSWLTMDVLVNDKDLDGDDLTLQSAQTNYGGVAINGNKLRFVPDEGFAGDVIIQYLVSDPSGETDTAQVLLSVEDNSTVNDPTIDPPYDISIIASGRLTKVEFGSATAVDVNGNMIPVELLNTQRSYPPGAHNVFWKATDKDGRVAIASQKVNIYPLVTITKGQLVEEGSEAVVKVHLNGLSPAYPIVIPYTVQSEATAGIDYELTDGEIRINEGTQTELRFQTYLDETTEGPEDVFIVLGDTPYKTNEFIHKATIVETNIKPRVSLLTTQDNEQRFLIERSGGEVLVSATIFDGNDADSHTIEWLPGDGITRTNDATDQNFTFAVLDMTTGIYQIGAKVTDNGASVLSAQTQIYIELVDGLPSLGSGDTDGDLLSDAMEGYGDDDADHIPNYLDPISDCNLIPQQANTVERFLIEGQSGGCLRRGHYTTSGQSNGVMINDSQSPLPADADTNNVGGLFDFVVHNIKDDSGTYSIVIPQRQPVPQDAIYRKYSPDKGWYTFVEDDNNTIWSTAGNAGICPPPKDDAWVSGLHVGDWCVQITIEDGGANDDDGLVNNTITDPGGIAVYKSSNNFPVAVDDLGELSWNSTASFEVLSNDTDADDDSLEVINAQAELGSVEIDGSMTLSYTALENFVGEDQVNYSISDGHGGIATAILTLSVKGNNAPDANNDTASTTNNLAITINALSNDTDEDGDALTITDASADFGIVTITGNKLLYTPKAAFEGTVTITYAIEDSAGATDTGKVFISVTAPPVVVTPPPPTDNSSSDSGGGSLGIGLMLLGLVGVRRRR